MLANAGRPNVSVFAEHNLDLIFGDVPGERAGCHVFRAATSCVVGM
jgi:hypothetical protein